LKEKKKGGCGEELRGKEREQGKRGEKREGGKKGDPDGPGVSLHEKSYQKWRGNGGGERKRAQWRGVRLVPVKGIHRCREGQWGKGSWGITGRNNSSGM